MRKSLIISLFSFIVFSSLLPAQERIIIESRYLKCNDTCLVFTPAAETGEDTPTLFLLHGWAGCYRNWSDAYDIQAISTRTGFRIICPDGFYNSWYLDNTDSTKMQWRTFWNKEFFPLMKEKYSLKPELTFITGLSMGGHGAINLYFDHPESFRSAGSMSGVLNLQFTSLKESQLSKVLGEFSKDNPRYDTESAVFRIDDYINNYPHAKEKVLVITCGYEDIYVACTHEFTSKCRSVGIPYVEVLSKATHSWKYWGFALEEHLWLFNRILRNENLGF